MHTSCCRLIQQASAGRPQEHGKPVKRLAGKIFGNFELRNLSPQAPPTPSPPSPPHPLKRDIIISTPGLLSSSPKRDPPPKYEMGGSA